SGDIPKRASKAAKPDADLPPALAEALTREPEAAAKFDAFPPGARRDYCDWIAEAKRDATRDKRIADAIGWIREGKKRNWKYESR
ncbi:MAG: YdeI/OmpD-associated family protein, partial [Sphingomonas sp.]